jgi:hypothetical protein
VSVELEYIHAFLNKEQIIHNFGVDLSSQTIESEIDGKYITKKAE